MLKLAWDFTIHTSTHDAIWSVELMLLNGKILRKNNDVISCSFDRNNTKVLKIYQSKIRECHLQTNYFRLNDSSTQSGSYRVILMLQVLITVLSVSINPSNLVASPYGWHDTNGVTRIYHY
jgi:hypothetical protein